MAAPPKLNRIPLGEAIDRYLDAVSAQVTVGDRSPQTRDNYAADLRSFVEIVGADTIADDISGEDVDAALVKFGNQPDRRYTDPSVKRGAGKGPGAQQRFRQSISKFFSHALKSGWVQASPMEWASLNPRDREGLSLERRALTPEQAIALLEHGPGEPPAENARPHERNWARDRFIISTFLILGPRVSELAKANLEDMWVDDGQVIWRIVGKGGKVRYVPLSPWLVERRDTYLDTRPEGADARPLVVSGRGNRMSARDLERIVDRAIERTQQAAPTVMNRRATAHALRHTAATIMLSAGWDVKVVAQMLGHASIATTGKYLDDLPGELAQAVASHPLSQAARETART